MGSNSISPTSWSTEAKVGGALTFVLPVATVLFGHFTLRAKPSAIASAAALAAVLPACYTYAKVGIPKDLSQKTPPHHSSHPTKKPTLNPKETPVSEKYLPQKGGGTLTKTPCYTVKFTDSSTVLELKIQDIVANIDVEAIVNAANAQLQLGGGVAGAIKKADKSGNVQKECNNIGGTPTGTAVLTSAGSISLTEFMKNHSKATEKDKKEYLDKTPLKHVIHAVGPVYSPSQHEESCRLLYEAYTATFTLAKEKGIRSLAIPFLSADIFGFYADKGSSKIALRAAQDFVQKNPKALDLIRFVSLQETQPYLTFQNELEVAYEKIN
ncbi:MAG: macro domain-containing protein [Verrucomicrobia bacterium]|nr:macro domain-containing protein [Verrucomicrobiota bacterium]